jgi:transcription initiation factor TFIID subunit 7
MADCDQLVPQHHPFEDFKRYFPDERHARVHVFDENLDGLLVKLPAYIETHRTIDGSNLFKSADVSEMLVAYRHNLPPQPVIPDFDFEHRLTPSMRDIVSKRQANAAQDTAFLEGIDYLEIVEIQVAALISKDDNTKPVCRHEFHDEAEEDPIILEKVFRTHGYPELRGYSGLEISDEQLAEIAVDDEPVVQVPPDVFGVEEPSPKGTDIELVLEEEEEEDVADIGSSPAPSPQAIATEGETESESDDEDEEEEEQNKVELLRNRLEVLETTRCKQMKEVENGRNEEMRARLQARVHKMDEDIEAIKRQIAEFEK